MKRGGAALGLSCVFSCAATIALAQPATKPKPRPPAPAPSPSASASAASSASSSATGPSRASSIGYLAGAIAQALGPIAPGALVAVSPLASDLPAPKAEELAL